LNWEGAIFDWDGVIVDSSDLHKKSWEALASELLLPLPPDHFEKGFGKRNETIIPKILKWTQDRSEVEAWGKRKEEIYREMAKINGIKLAPGAVDFLTKTNAIGINCAIGTSTERKNIELAIEEHGLSDFFQGAACSEDVKKGKPDPEVFLKAAHILSIESERCIIFEDSPHGVEAGIKAGMKTIALTTSHPSNAFMHLKPDLIVNSLAGVEPESLISLFE
tara:strand:+ start:7060 stop:7722 length:663 start_codon:yes stop_codon:yes gene_type:complete